MYDVQDLASPRLVEAMDIAISNNSMIPFLGINSSLVEANNSGGVEVFSYAG